MTRACFPDKIDNTEKSSHQTPANHGGQSRRGSHRLGCIPICERYYKFSYVDGLRLRETPVRMLRGTLVHTCLAYHFGRNARIRPSFIDKPIEQALLEDGEGRTEEIENALRCYQAYDLYYSGDYWDPVLVETELTATVKELDPEGEGPEDEEEVTCRPDLVGWDNGELTLVDHKTTGGYRKRLEPLSSGFDPFPYRWQLHFNHGICNTLKNREILGGAVEKVKIQRIKATEPYDFDRHTVDLAQNLLSGIGRRVRYAVRRELELKARIANGDEPEPLGLMNGACENGGFLCDYAALCGSSSWASAEKVMPIIFKKG